MYKDPKLKATKFSCRVSLKECQTGYLCHCIFDMTLTSVCHCTLQIRMLVAFSPRHRPQGPPHPDGIISAFLIGTSVVIGASRAADSALSVRQSALTSNRPLSPDRFCSTSFFSVSFLSNSPSRVGRKRKSLGTRADDMLFQTRESRPYKDQDRPDHPALRSPEPRSEMTGTKRADAGDSPRSSVPFLGPWVFPIEQNTCPSKCLECRAIMPHGSSPFMPSWTRCRRYELRRESPGLACVVLLLSEF